MARILIVEDELNLAEGLRYNLEEEGHEVAIVRDGEEAVERLTDPGESFDLVILDVMLPGISGFEVAERARAAGNLLPILILTAKDEASDVVRGLEAGADDYLTKPFELDELLARVRVLLRRRRWDGATRGGVPAPFRVGRSTIHFDRFEIEGPRGTVRLTTREAALLRALVDRAGEVVSRAELLEEVWGLRRDTRTRVVDSFVVRLRRYLEPDPAHPRHILSVRGQGYRLEP